MTRLLTIFLLLAAFWPASAQTLEEAKALEEAGYLDKALEIYTRINKERPGGVQTKAAALNGMASILAISGKYDSVQHYLDLSRFLDSTPQNLVNLYQAEARYWQSKNNYDLALKSLQLAKDNAEILNDKKNLALIFSNMGSIYFSHQPDKSVARDYILKSNELIDSASNYNLLARNYGRLANVAMATNNSPVAKIYLERARKITDLSDNLPVKAYILSSYAILLFEDNKITEGIAYQQQSIDIKRKLGQLRSLQNDLLNISESYVALKMYDKAEAAIAEGKSISKSLKDAVYLKYFYEHKSTLDSLRGDYKSAYSNYKLAMRYKDSTFSAQHFRDVREIQEKYEAGQKEKIITEKELEIEHQKYRQVIILSTFFIALLILVVVLIILRSRNKKRQNYLRLQTIVNTQEEVQQRIARDLHDGLVQILGAAKVSLQSISPGSDTSVVQKQVRTASDIVDEAVNEARSISHQALPYSLLKDGLISALEELFARSLSSFEFDHDEIINTNEQTAINLYRIAQELVNNIQKYAESAHVKVSLKVTDQTIRFIFIDNGPGFDTSHISKGAGLSNISTRAELIGGTIVVKSVIGKGTTTELTVPL